MGPKPKRPVASKQFSCSELKDGHEALITVKKENLSQEDLQRQIKEYERELRSLRKAAKDTPSEADAAGGMEEEEPDTVPDLFVSRITKTISKTNKLSRRKKRGWYTKEQMATVLQWSASYIKSVIEYCEKPGNERLVKRDRYNKKLKKYYVVYEENDTELSEDEERHEHKDQEVDADDVEFSRLGQPRATSDSEGGDTEKEEKAEQVNTAQKEYQKFKQFTDSLLSRSSKIAELMANLETALTDGGKDHDSAEGKRVTKQVASLEQAIETLEKEFESCEAVKVEVSDLSKGDVDPSSKSQLLKKIDAQMRSTTIKCSKVTTAEVAGRNLMKQFNKKPAKE